MEKRTVDAYGRVTLPMRVRRALRLIPGDRVLFIPEKDGSCTLLATNRDVTRLKGIIPKRSRPVTLKEMRRSIRAST